MRNVFYKPLLVKVFEVTALTLRLLRLAGLVADGLGDFPDRGVDSWLPAVPLAEIKNNSALTKKILIFYSKLKGKTILIIKSCMQVD